MLRGLRASTRTTRKRSNSAETGKLNLFYGSLASTVCGSRDLREDRFHEGQTVCTTLAVEFSRLHVQM